MLDFSNLSVFPDMVCNAIVKYGIVHSELITLVWSLMITSSLFG